MYYIDTTYRIHTILVSHGNSGIPTAGFPAILNRFLFLTPEAEIADIITRTNPTIKSVTVTKEYPDTVKLSITRYEPAAYLKSIDGYFLLADDAIILGKYQELENSRLPVITYYQAIPFVQYQIGTQIPAKDIRDGIYFAQELRNRGIQINSIDIVGFHMLGLYTEEKEFYFSSEKERNTQIYHIEQSLKRLELDDVEYTAIDVRFEKPVISF